MPSAVRFFLLVLILPAVGFCQKVALSLGSGSATPGSTLTLDLTISSQQALPAGVEWTLTYWPVDVASVQVAPGPAALAAGKSVWCQGGAGTYTCILTGINSNVIPDGVVAKVFIQLSATTTDGVSSMRLDHVVAAAADGTNILAATSPAVVTITQHSHLTGIACTSLNVLTGGVTTCTVLLSAPAPASGVKVTLSSSTTSITVPGSLIVPAGAASAGFNITTFPVSTTVMAQIQAKSGATTLSGTVILTAPGAAVAVAGVVSAADYVQGPVAPGEIVAILGSGMGPQDGAGMQVSSGIVAAKLAGAQVLFDGVAAPLLYVRSDQINAVVPYSVTGRTSTKLQIHYGDVLSAASTIPVAQTAPAIFSLGSSGTGQGAILNEDGTVNSPANPSRAGSVVVIFGTGQGLSKPAPLDGSIIGDGTLPKPVTPVSVHIGGVEAEVLYAGAAPELVAGVLQVNARIPNGITSGPAVPVSLGSGGRTSQAGLTLAIQ